MPTVYKDARSRFYQADIWIGGRKFHRSTKSKDKREAHRIADQLERELRKRLKTSADSEASLLLDAVAGRYMRDIGDHHKGALGTESRVAKLLAFFGTDKPLDAITHGDALRLLHWRKAQTWKGRPLSPYTVNDTVEQLKKLFTYCKNHGIRFSLEPKWSDPQLWLDEPGERVISLTDAQTDALSAATAEIRADYEPLIEFAWSTGKRLSECLLLEWSDVNWDRRLIQRPGKRGRSVEVEITDHIRGILWPLWMSRAERHPTRVFTFKAQRTIDKVIRGRRYTFVRGQHYPITKSGLRRVWTQVRKAAGIPTTGASRFRFHDLRHDFATKLLWAVKADSPAAALRVVQKALDHAKIETTMRYAHVTAAEVAQGIEAVATARRSRRGRSHPTDHPTVMPKVG